MSVCVCFWTDLCIANIFTPLFFLCSLICWAQHARNFMQTIVSRHTATILRHFSLVHEKTVEWGKYWSDCKRSWHRFTTTKETKVKISLWWQRWCGVHTCVWRSSRAAAAAAKAFSLGYCLWHVFCGGTYNNHRLYWHRFNKYTYIVVGSNHEFPFQQRRQQLYQQQQRQHP